jgi:sulfur-carrier protein
VTTVAASTDQPAVQVVLAPALLRLFPYAPGRLNVHAATVAGVIAELEKKWPGMGHMLCNERPAVRAHINVFVGGERVALDTMVVPGSIVYILTSVSGG